MDRPIGFVSVEQPIADAVRCEDVGAQPLNRGPAMDESPETANVDSDRHALAADGVVVEPTSPLYMARGIDRRDGTMEFADFDCTYFFATESEAIAAMRESPDDLEIVVYRLTPICRSRRQPMAFEDIPARGESA